jgi:hypothetical protein
MEMGERITATTGIRHASESRINDRQVCQRHPGNPRLGSLRPCRPSLASYSHVLNQTVAGRAESRFFSGTVESRAITALTSTSPAFRSAATKFLSFSRKAQSFATHRSSLSRHQPVNRGHPEGAAAPALGQRRSLQVGAVDAESVELLEG